MSDYLTPLEVCEHMIGPYPTLEGIAGKRPKAAYAWLKGAKSRRAGDLPPAVQRKFLEHAERKGIPLKAEYLIRGADAAEVLKILLVIADPTSIAQFKLWLRERGEGVRSVAAE